MSESRKIRLLIIEDNVADVLLMREALRELCSFVVEVRSVPDGEEALALLKQGTEFDVVILDLALPKMDGHTFLERYRSHFPPIVVFSSSWNNDDSKRAIALGAKQFVRKPSTYDEYVDAVCGIVERWGNIAKV